MDNNRAEAERWLGVAERLLASRDLHGTRTFAIRVRDFNPILADQILAVADTLLAAQSDPIDWYRILQLAPLTQSAELVATQYRKLALLLNPARNNLLYADQAFRLVSDAWSVLSNPSKKAIYDNELRLGQLGSVSQPSFATQLGLGSPLDQVFQLGQHQQPQPQPPPPAQQQHHQHQQPQRETATTPVGRTERVIQFGQPQELEQRQQHQHQHQQQKETGTPARKSSRGKDGRTALEEERPRPESTPHTEPTRRTQINQTELTRPSSGNQTEAAGANRQTDSTPSNQAARPKVPSFWTACPYCYVIYEYPKVYEDCTLRCQKCRRAFHAATIPSPPVSEKETHFCCWAYFPVGVSGNARGASGGAGAFPSWSPISPMFACPVLGEGKENTTQEQNKNLDKQSNAKSSAPRVYYDDDDVYVEISDMSDESEDGEYWIEDRRRKQPQNAKGKVTVSKNASKPQSERVRKGNNLDSGINLGSGSAVPEGAPVAESSRRGLGNGRRQMRNGAKDLGKLDLNVEFSNEVEEPTTRRREGNGPGYGEEDNIEGNGFFEGLDEFLSSLPILSVVANDKVKAT
ncbi:hypothetical protein SLEP1_g14775 [Rubroshorea leprosula]|uniref:J domain-containing protein n=1 Tax=Rubroshorea leprosula TaxID=152421 RepID=A0AAV5IPJ8_9ROSI|nr:hypothetical protein SLEP1_g14775 [Rubroshorea leprosula]